MKPRLLQSVYISSVEVGLWITAIICGGVLGSTLLQARGAERAAANISTSRQTRVERNKTTLQGAQVSDEDGAVIGRLDIPEVALSVPILENYDPATLKRGVGHIPGTAFPGGLGNLGVAGHRDTYFRPLRNIHKGMEINVTTIEGTFHYQIDSTEIVTPDNVRVLDIRSRPELTLITCYPFNFIGAAPSRFIVHAHLLSLDPS